MKPLSRTLSRGECPERQKGDLLSNSMLRYLGLLAGTLLPVLASSAGELAVPPYLQLYPDGGMTVMWNTEKPAYSWIEYAESEILDNQADRVVDGLRQANTTRHQITLPDCGRNGLYYRVGWKNIISFGAYEVTFEAIETTETYKVRPIPGPADPVRVAIFNDLHDNHPLFSKLTDQLKGFDYDFSVFNGDCFSDPTTEDRFVSSLKIYNAGVRSWERPVIYQRGNHEYRGAFARELRGWFSPPGGNFYGAFSAGPVRFIMLDAGEDKDDSHWAYSGLNDFSGYRREQAEFLKKELASKAFKSATYRILIHHIPLYDEDPDREYSKMPRDAWEDVLKDAPITLAICGHTHRHVVHQTGAVGNPYPLAIGGGSQDEGATVMKLEATMDQLTLTMLDVDGNTVESLEIPAPKKKKWWLF